MRAQVPRCSSRRGTTAGNARRQHHGAPVTPGARLLRLLEPAPGPAHWRGWLAPLAPERRAPPLEGCLLQGGREGRARGGGRAEAEERWRCNGEGARRLRKHHAHVRLEWRWSNMRMCVMMRACTCSVCWSERGCRGRRMHAYMCGKAEQIWRPRLQAVGQPQRPWLQVVLRMTRQRTPMPAGLKCSRNPRSRPSSIKRAP